MANAPKKKASKKAAPKKVAAKKPAATKPAATKPAPALKKAAPVRAPTSVALSAFLGTRLVPTLAPKAAQRLRKALPGYGSVLDDAADQLAEDQDALNLSDVTPEKLEAAQADLKFLAAREAVVEAVYNSIYHQRLVADDLGIGMLQKIARRVNAVSEDDPEIMIRWKFLLDYLGSFHSGGRPPGSGSGGGAGGTGEGGEGEG